MSKTVMVNDLINFGALDHLSNGERYLLLKDAIDALEGDKKDIGTKIGLGDIVEHNGETYEWVSYERTSTGWKGIYEESYTMLDDEAQVIMGEMIARKTKKGLYHKFEKK